MATGSLGSLVISLEANTAKLDSDLGKAAYLLQKRSSEMSAKTIAIGTAIGTQIGHFASEVIERVAEIIPETIERMDKLSKAAEKVGLPTEEFSKLNYAAGLADVATESLEKSLGKLIKSEGAALNATSQQAKVFDALGISIKNADGSLRPASDVLAQFADRFKSLKGSPEAIAAGMAIFGRNFQEIIPLLNQGSAGIKEAADEADRFHITLSEATGKAAEEADDNIKRLHSVFDGLKQQVAADLLPQLNELLTWAINFTADGANAAQIADDIATAFHTMVDAGKDIAQVVGLVERLHAALQGSDEAAHSLSQASPGSAVGRFLKDKFPALYAQPFDNSQDAANQSNFTGPASLQIPILNRQPFSAVPLGVDRSKAPDLGKLHSALANTPTARSSSSNFDAQTRAAEQFQLALKTLADEMNGPLGKAEADHERRLLQLDQLAKKGKVSHDDLAKAVDLEGQRYAKATDEIKRQFEVEIAGLSGPVAQEESAHEERLHQIDEIAKNYGLSTERLNVLLAEEAKQHNLAAAAAKRQADPMGALLADMKTDVDLLGMSNDERAVANELMREGIDLYGKEGQAALAQARMLDQLGESRQKNIQFMDSFRSDLTDLGVTAITNFKGISDSFRKMMDDLYQQIMRRIVENWVNGLFGQQGTTGQGTQGGGVLGGFLSGLFGNGTSTNTGAGAAASNSSGGTSGAGFWGTVATWAASLFGGGHANGGPTMRGRFYEVGEMDRPELYSEGGRSYLLPGNNGNVTPIRAASGGKTVNNYFSMSKRNDNRSERQVAKATGIAIRQA